MGSRGSVAPPRGRWFALAVTLGLLGALFVLTAPPAQAAPIVVNTTLDVAPPANGDGCTLREALINTQTDAQTWTDCATGSGANSIGFSVTGVITLVSQLPTPNALSINGPGASLLAIDGDGNQVFTLPPGTSVNLSDLTIEDAASSNGGAILSFGTLSVTRCTFSGNTATSDGGAIESEGTLVVADSTFTGNNAGNDNGGAIHNYGPLTVTNTIFSLNDAGGDGGAIYNLGGNVTVANSAFSGNGAASDGGGIYHNDDIFNQGVDTLIVTNSSLSGNDAGAFGGGIFVEDGTATVTNSTLSDNSATVGGGVFHKAGALTVASSTFSSDSAIVDGGGIHNNGTLAVTNSTLSNNISTGPGGGIYNSGGSVTLTNSTLSNNTSGSLFSGSGTVTVNSSTLVNDSVGGGTLFNAGTTTLRSTIVASVAASDCLGAITDGGYNLSSDSSCGFGGTSQPNTDPQLQPLADNGGPTQTMALDDSSPAANVIPEGQPPGAGCGTTIDTDQRGFARPEDDFCEIGAYEIQDQVPQPPPFVSAPDAVSMTPTSGPVGTLVTITGTNLAQATVRFNGVVAQVLTNTPTQIVVSVPGGAATGPVTVSTSGGSDAAGTFTVTPPSGPQITGFSPTQGQVGTTVVISGSGFTGTAVSFGGVPAVFVVDSPTQITATVPAHAGTGPISVTIAQGTGTSAEDFVVSHGRSIGLHFSSARGSVGVTDGFSGCAAGVLVRLQIAVDGGFTTVASTSTNAHGAYRFGNVSEPGSYRVVAKKVTVPSGDVCLRAASSVVAV